MNKEERANNTQGKKGNNKEKSIEILSLLKKKSTYFFLLAAVIAVIGVCLVAKGIASGSGNAAAAYETAKSKKVEELGEEFYQKAFDSAEKANHTSNRVSLDIESIKEVAKLEVLKVSDVEFVTTDADENKDAITAVLEVPGSGVFTVDLQKAEFVVDKARSYVLVRLPNPELSECKIDYGNAKKLIFKNEGGNDSIEDGEDLARAQLKEGYLLIKKEFLINSKYFKSAKTAAERAVTSLVKEFNPTVEDLIVEIEFLK